MDDNQRRRLYYLGKLVAIGALGACAYVAPIVILPSHTSGDGLFSTVRSAVEGAGPFTMLLLFLVGLVAGVVLRTTSAWICGLAAVALLPLTAFVEILIDPTSHNLWPLEVVFYGLESLFAVAGAAFIRVLLPTRE